MATSPFTRVAQEYLVERQLERHNVRSYFFNDRGESPILRPSRGFRDSLWDHSRRFDPRKDYTFRVAARKAKAANGRGDTARPEPVPATAE
ncbi:hypothetical protein [Nocardia sp. NPDC051570]|uniref:hypothetical protein n=1 Tax=Nocardia sp. NPDC051570 TaxID=3364324 RepID=UPI00378F48EC